MKKLLISAALTMGLALPAMADVEGSWRVTWKGPFGHVYETLNIWRVGDGWVGRIATQNIGDLSVEGDSFSFSTMRIFPFGQGTLNFSGELVGGRIEGEILFEAAAPIPVTPFHSITGP